MWRRSSNFPLTSFILLNHAPSRPQPSASSNSIPPLLCIIPDQKVYIIWRVSFGGFWFSIRLGFFFLLIYCCAVAFQKQFYPRHYAYIWGGLPRKGSWFCPWIVSSLVPPKQRRVKSKCALLYKIVLKYLIQRSKVISQRTFQQCFPHYT